MREEEEKSEKNLSGSMKDLARRILLTGLGAVFMTEEGIRKSLGDLKIPKDAMTYLLETMRKQKDEVLGAVAQELGKFFSKVKVHEELRKALTGMSLHLDAKLTFDQLKKGAESLPKLSLKKATHRRSPPEE